VGLVILGGIIWATFSYFESNSRVCSYYFGGNFRVLVLLGGMIEVVLVLVLVLEAGCFWRNDRFGSVSVSMFVSVFVSFLFVFVFVFQFQVHFEVHVQVQVLFG
jgi:hypothetical protein